MRRCARREIDQIISLNRGRVRFQPPYKPRRTSITPVVRGIFSTRRRSNYCADRVSRFSPSLSRTPRATRLFCKHSKSTCAHGDAANRLIMGAFEGSLLFAVPRLRRIALAEKFRGIWEVSSAPDLLLASAIDASPVSRASWNDLILLIKSNEK